MSRTIFALGLRGLEPFQVAPCVSSASSLFAGCRQQHMALLYQHTEQEL
jgi:hypothetical protein